MTARSADSARAVLDYVGVRMMSGVGTFWRTVRHLKPGQVIGRVRFRLHHPKPKLGPAPAPREASGPWAVPAARAASLVGPGRLLLLNVERELSECGWDDSQSRLEGFV